MNQDGHHRVNPDPKEAIRGKLLEILNVNDQSTQGNKHYSLDYEVPHKTPGLDPKFGLLSSRTRNERNGNKSRRTDLYVDTYDLFPLPTVEHTGLEALGADDTYATTILKDSSSMSVEDLECGHNVISSLFQGLDRVHGQFTKTEVSQWKPRISKSFNADLGSEITVIKQVLPAIDSDLTVEGEKLNTQVEQIGKDKFLKTISVLPEGGGDGSTSSNSFGSENCKTTTTKTPVEKGFKPDKQPIDVIESYTQPLSETKDLWVVTKIDDGWPVLVSYEEEPSTGISIKITREVIESIPEERPSEIGKTYSYKHVGCNKAVKTTREIDDSIEQRKEIEYHHVEYDFPSYMKDPPFPTFNLGGGPWESYANPRLSSSQRFKIPCRFEITYHKEQPDPTELFQFKTVDFFITGFSGFVSGTGGIDPFTVSLNNAITDQHTFNLFIFHQGLYNLVDVTIPRSSPSSSEYDTLMRLKKEGRILEDVSKWKYNLWRRVLVYMPFPDLREESFTANSFKGTQNIPN